MGSIDGTHTCLNYDETSYCTTQIHKTKQFNISDAEDITSRLTSKENTKTPIHFYFHSFLPECDHNTRKNGASLSPGLDTTDVNGPTVKKQNGIHKDSSQEERGASVHTQRTKPKLHTGNDHSTFYSHRRNAETTDDRMSNTGSLPNMQNGNCWHRKNTRQECKSTHFDPACLFHRSKERVSHDNLIQEESHSIPPTDNSGCLPSSHTKEPEHDMDKKVVISDCDSVTSNKRIPEEKIVFEFPATGKALRSESSKEIASFIAQLRHTHMTTQHSDSGGRNETNLNCSLKVGQYRSVNYSEQAGLNSGEQIPQEYENIRTLHANVASKSDDEFQPDLGKTESLLFFERAVIDVILNLPLVRRELEVWEIWRLSTFSALEDLAVFAIRLAQSGFYYNVTLDDIICFSCGLPKREWHKSDKPALLHLQLSPECKHAKFQDDKNIPISTDSYPLLPSWEEPGQPGNTSDGIIRDGEHGAQTVTAATKALAVSSERSQNHGVDITSGTNGFLASTPPVSRSSSSSNGSVTPTAGLCRSSETTDGSVTTTASVRRSCETSSGSVTPIAGPSRSSSASNGTVTTTASQSPVSASSAGQCHDPAPGEQAASATPHQHSSNGSASLVDTNLQSDDGELDAVSRLDMRRAASPANAPAAVRLQSFMDWPTVGLPSVRLLMPAGFYYLGIGDSVRCFFCGLTLRNWKEDDDPWVTHVRFRFSCDYVKAVKGDKYIIQTQIQLARESASHSAPNREQRPVTDFTPERTSPGTFQAPTPSSGTSPSPTTASNNPTRASSASQTTSSSVPPTPSPASVRMTADSTQNGGESDDRSSKAVLSTTQPQTGSALLKHYADGNEGSEIQFASDGSKGVALAGTVVGGSLPTACRGGTQTVAFCTQTFTGPTEKGAAYVAEANQKEQIGSAANHEQANDGTANQDTTYGNAANQDQPDRSSTSQDEQRANRAASNQDHPYRHRANQDNASRAADAEVTTQATAISHTRSDALQTDAEPAAAPNDATRSTPPRTLPSAIQQIVPGRPGAAPSSSSTHVQRPASFSSSRHGSGHDDERAYLHQLQETNQRLRRSRMCRLCGRQNVDTIFMPCGHLCTCSSCAPTIEHCCLCRKRIRATAAVYLD